MSPVSFVHTCSVRIGSGHVAMDWHTRQMEPGGRQPIALAALANASRSAIGPVTCFSASRELISRGTALRKKHNLCGHIHLLETQGQALQSRQYFGERALLDGRRNAEHTASVVTITRTEKDPVKATLQMKPRRQCSMALLPWKALVRPVNKTALLPLNVIS
jgi:cytosine/adenosine deaminase-related metal-dependent hydrolase